MSSYDGDSVYNNEHNPVEVDKDGELILPHQRWRKERAELPVSSEGSLDNWPFAVIQ